MLQGPISRLVVCFFVSLFLAGCVETRQPQVEVRGRLQTADGKPLPAGTTILLNPTEGKVGTASGKTDADGSFTLTHVSGSGGPEVGKYSVKLLAPDGNRNFYKTIPSDVVNGDVLVADVREGMGPLELKLPKTGKARPRH